MGLRDGCRSRTGVDHGQVWITDGQSVMDPSVGDRLMLTGDRMDPGKIQRVPGSEVSQGCSQRSPRDPKIPGMLHRVVPGCLRVPEVGSDAGFRVGLRQDYGRLRWFTDEL